jgi:hypothetical protein
MSRERHVRLGDPRSLRRRVTCGGAGPHAVDAVMVVPNVLRFPSDEDHRFGSLRDLAKDGYPPRILRPDPRGDLRAEAMARIRPPNLAANLKRTGPPCS